MSILFILWLAAIFVLGSTLVYAYAQTRRVGISSQIRVPNDFSEFISLELHDIFLYIQRLFHVVRPHGEHAAGYVVLVSRRGYDLFIERIFGRKEVTKGKTTSFYLKRISEQEDPHDEEKDIPVQ